MFVSSRAWFQLATSALFLHVVSGCGYITVGNDFGPAPDAAPDGGVEIDTGVIDGGEDPVDTGIHPDASDCTPLVPPALPTAWPFARSRSAYKNVFWDDLPKPLPCGTTGCHSTFEPAMPASDLDLENPDLLESFIDELWARVPADGSGMSELFSYHGPPANMTPPFSMEQIDYLNNFIARCEACRWVGVVAGPNDCPVPVTPEELALCEAP